MLLGVGKRKHRFFQLIQKKQPKTTSTVRSKPLSLLLLFSQVTTNILITSHSHSHTYTHQKAISHSCSFHPLQDVKLYCRVHKSGNQWWSQAPHKAFQTQRRNQEQLGGCSCPPILNLGWLSRPLERNSSWVGWERLQSCHLWYERRWEVNWEGFSNWVCRNQGCYCCLQVGLWESLCWQDFVGGFFCRYNDFFCWLVCNKFLWIKYVCLFLGRKIFKGFIFIF